MMLVSEFLKQISQKHMVPGPEDTPEVAAAKIQHAQAYAAVEAAARGRNTFLKLLNLLLQNS